MDEGYLSRTGWGDRKLKGDLELECSIFIGLPRMRHGVALNWCP